MVAVMSAVCVLATLGGINGDVALSDSIVESPDPQQGGVMMSQEELDRAATIRANVLKEHAARDGKRPRNCTSDMRPRLPACKQATPFWCWATGITDLHYFYNASEARACKSIE